MHQVDKDVRAQRDSPTDAAERGNVETDRAAFALNHQFNRLSLQLRGSITDLAFAPVTSTSGAIISNADRNTTQREAAFRTSWALNGRTDVFAEVGRQRPRLPRGSRRRHPALLDRRALPARRRVRAAEHHVARAR